MQVAKSCYC